MIHFVLSIPPILLIVWMVTDQLDQLGRFALFSQHRPRKYLVALIDSTATAVVAMTFTDIWPALLSQLTEPPASNLQRWMAQIAWAILHAASLCLAVLATGTAITILSLWAWRAVRGTHAEHHTAPDPLGQAWPIAPTPHRERPSGRE